MVNDPICGVSFSEEKAGAIYDSQGESYYFCSPECRDRFLRLFDC